jgi:hypothetical protein
MVRLSCEIAQVNGSFLTYGVRKAELAKVRRLPIGLRSWVVMTAAHDYGSHDACPRALDIGDCVLRKCCCRNGSG